jgi:hypothetical protein
VNEENNEIQWLCCIYIDVAFCLPAIVWEESKRKGKNYESSIKNVDLLEGIDAERE